MLVEGEWVMQATKEERENGPEKPRRPVGWAGGSWLVVAGERERREREGREVEAERREEARAADFFWRANKGAFSADNIATKTKANLCSYSGGAVDPPSLTAGDGESGVGPSDR